MPKHSTPAYASRDIDAALSEASKMLDLINTPEAQLTDDLADIVARWDDLAAQVEPLEVPLE